MAQDDSKATYALISLGCHKNLVDSERMAGLLKLEGYRMVETPQGADFVVINTCGFIADARQESNGAIGEMCRLKRDGKLTGLIVAGCLAERDKEKLLVVHPEIDQLVGVFGRDEITAAADRLIGGLSEQRTVFHPAPTQPLHDDNRLRITPPHLAFLKIAEGCNRLCSFCAIPALRGKYASKPVEEVVDEARRLADDGTKELVLVAQDSSYYGTDLYGQPRLAELLTQLEGIDSLAWIRLMYLYPTQVTDELIDVLASGKKIVPYLDIPLQHINDEVLRRMRRQVGREQSKRLIDRLRSRIEGLVLRTTFLTGFPGETDQQFEELLEFVQGRRFERLGVFAFSSEPGTSAAELDGAVPEGVKHSRRDRLLAAQQEIAFDWAKAQVGRRMDVLIDRYMPGQSNAYVGRTYADAPEIDPVVYVTGEDLSPGGIVSCEIVTSQGYDLVGVVCR